MQVKANVFSHKPKVRVSDSNVSQAEAARGDLEVVTLDNQVLRHNVQDFRQSSGHTALVGQRAIDGPPLSILVILFLAEIDDCIAAVLVDHRAALEALVAMPGCQRASTG